MIDHPTAKVDKLMEFLPDLTSLQGLSSKGVMKSRRPETGKGRVVVRSKTEIEKAKRW